MMMYDASNWYWCVGGDASNVWSSKRAMSVPIDDAEYTAWLAAVGGPSPLATMQELYDLLAGQFPAGSLQTYNPDARFSRASVGVIVTSLSPVAFNTDVVSRNTINSTYTYLIAKGSGSVEWKMSDGSFVTLDGAQITTLMNSVAAFVQACFDCESNNQAAIGAGSLTTLQQIDDAFAAISNVYP
jgi:hypothetical protein